MTTNIEPLSNSKRNRGSNPKDSCIRLAGLCNSRRTFVTGRFDMAACVATA